MAIKRVARIRPPSAPKADYFMMQKVSLCGNQIKREAVKYLTVEECDDTTRFPLGKQKDAKGEFVWQRSLVS